MKKILLILLLIIVSSPGNFILAQPCSNLFISQYIEGSKNNKAIQIYNPTSSTIQLSGYELFLFANGADSSSFHHKMNGQITSKGVYVIANSRADSLGILIHADTTSIVCNWNGDDAVVLVNYITGDTLDIIGQIGVDPGTSWQVGDTGSTENHTLVRKADVHEGTSDWNLSATQWDVYGVDDFSHLTFHDMDTCEVSPDPQLFFNVKRDSVVENEGPVVVQIGIVNPNSNPTSVTVSAINGTATSGSDYIFSPQIITFEADSSTPIDISCTIVNDAITEPDENFTLTLSDPTNNATITNASVQITILDNDGLGVHLPYPEKSFSVSPNPTDGSIELVKLSSGADWIHVVNVLGQSLIEIYPGNKNSVTIDLNRQPGGIYFVQMMNNGILTSKKIIKK